MWPNYLHRFQCMHFPKLGQRYTSFCFTLLTPNKFAIQIFSVWSLVNSLSEVPIEFFFNFTERIICQKCESKFQETCVIHVSLQKKFIQIFSNMTGANVKFIRKIVPIYRIPKEFLQTKINETLQNWSSKFPNHQWKLIVLHNRKGWEWP